MIDIKQIIDSAHGNILTNKFTLQNAWDVFD
jgi:hypothetical protein